MKCSSGFSPTTKGILLANIDPKLNCSAKKMSEAVPALKIKSVTDAELPLRLEKPLPETPVSEEPFSKPSTLSEQSGSVNDIQARKEPNSQDPVERRERPLPASPSRAEIRNFSRPLDTPREPLGSRPPPPPNFFRSPRPVGSSRYSQGGVVSPAAGDFATASDQLSSVNGGRLEEKHKNDITCREGEDAGPWGKDRSCSQCGLM